MERLYAWNVIHRAAETFGLETGECFVGDTSKFTAAGRFCHAITQCPTLTRLDFDDNFEPRDPVLMARVYTWHKIRRVAETESIIMNECFVGDTSELTVAGQYCYAVAQPAAL